jgi:hypothetical protein
MRCWLEWPGRNRLLLFAAAICFAAIICFLLPNQAWRERWPLGMRMRIPVPGVMLVLWTAGWFTVTFVRAEDLNVLAPVDYQRMLRGAASSAIVVGMALAAHLLTQ